MNFSKFILKNFQQIKLGGYIVFFKKIRSLIFLALQTPIYIIAFPIVFIVRLIKPFFLIRLGEMRRWDFEPTRRGKKEVKEYY